MTTVEFARAFKYQAGSLIAPWRDARKTKRGDCQDFAWTVLLIEAGGTARAILWLLTGRAMIFRCWSPVNGIIPRHAVLWVKGKGWIDSTNREWRDRAKPHRLAYPAGLPVLAALASAAYWHLI